MATPKGAGPLQELVAFDQRQAVDDGYGNTVAGDFEEQFQQHAAFIAMRGDERPEASGLASQANVIMHIRNSEQARRITAAWQARDTRRGTVFNIKTTTIDPSRAYIDLLCEYGVAPG